MTSKKVFPFQHSCGAQFTSELDLILQAVELGEQMPKMELFECCLCGSTFSLPIKRD